jgi:hypothetical protein
VQTVGLSSAGPRAHPLQLQTQRNWGFRTLWVSRFERRPFEATSVRTGKRTARAHERQAVLLGPGVEDCCHGIAQWCYVTLTLCTGNEADGSTCGTLIHKHFFLCRLRRVVAALALAHTGTKVALLNDRSADSFGMVRAAPVQWLLHDSHEDALQVTVKATSQQAQQDLYPGR